MCSASRIPFCSAQPALPRRAGGVVPGRLAGQALPLATVPACLLGSLSGRRLRYHSAQGQSCHVDVRQGWMPAPCHRAQRGCPQRCHRCARRGPAALVALGCSGQPLPRAQRAVRAVSASSPSKPRVGYRRCGALPACPVRVPTARASVARGRQRRWSAPRLLRALQRQSLGPNVGTVSAVVTAGGEVTQCLLSLGCPGRCSVRPSLGLSAGVC